MSRRRLRGRDADANVSQAIEVIRDILRGDLFGLEPEDALTAAASAAAYVAGCGGLGLRSFLRICGRSYQAVAGELSLRAEMKMDGSIWGSGAGDDEPLDRVIDSAMNEDAAGARGDILSFAWRVMDRLTGPVRRS